MKPEYLKMNPQHTVPTLDDRGFYLTESRAMLQYFANAYGTKKTESLYPTDPKKRAVIDERLIFDMGTLYLAFSDAYYPKYFEGQPGIDEEKLKKLDEKLGFLELYLTQTKYAAADHMTLADFCIFASLTTMEACKHRMRKFPNVVAYLAKCRAEIPNHKELNQVGADQFGKIV